MKKISMVTSISLLLVLSLFLCPANSIAENYKIGVCYSPGDYGCNPNDYKSDEEIEGVWKKDLSDMINSIGKGITHFFNGINSVQLVVQTEIIWGLAEKEEGKLDQDYLKRVKKFAELCRNVNLKWTPLLSFHYSEAFGPKWLLTKYDKNVRMMKYDGSLSEGNHMPYSPSSPVWENEASNWTEMMLNALKPYFGDVIEEVLVGNEMMYEEGSLTSYDPYTRDAWKKLYGDSSELPETLTKEFKNFRMEEWVKSLTFVINRAKETLDSTNVKVSTKFQTWYLAKGDENCGVSMEAADKIIANTDMDFVGIDEYPPNPDIYKLLSNEPKPLYMTEFNNHPPVPYVDKQRVKEWINVAINDYDIRYFTMFAWNPGDDFEMTNEHKDALYDIIQSLVPDGNQIGAKINVNSLATAFPNIILYTTVLDSEGNPVTGLTENDFTVMEQADDEASPVTESITSFVESGTAGSNVNISLCLVFDLSGSMDRSGSVSGKSKLDEAKAAANEFLMNTSPNDRCALVTFSSRADIVMTSDLVSTDKNNNGTYDIIETINGLRTSGNTYLYNGTIKGIETLTQEPFPKAVIIFTDGDADDKRDKNAAIEKAKNEGIPLYTIGLGTNPEDLKLMAEETGGSNHYAPTAQDMADIYLDIAQGVRSQYTIGYTSHNPEFDSTTRTVTVAYDDIAGKDAYVVNSRPEIKIDDATLLLNSQSQDQDIDLTISGTIMDIDAETQGQSLEAALFYRHMNSASYTKVPLALVNEGNDIYSFSEKIPASAVQKPGIQYYIYATDGVQEFYSPFNYNVLPYSIAVLNNHAPVIDHTPITTTLQNYYVIISAEIIETDNGDKVDKAILYYRVYDPNQLTPYFAIPMTTADEVNYNAEISADKVTKSGIEYFISAWDSFQTRSDHGTSLNPHFITPLVSDELFVVSVFPEDGATDVPPDVTIRVQLSKPVDPRSLNKSNICIREIGTGYMNRQYCVKSDINYDQNSNVLTIKPEENLNLGQDYQIVLTAFIKKADSEKYLTQFVSDFTTYYSGNKEQNRVLSKLEEYENATIHAIEGNADRIAYFMSEGYSMLTYAEALDWGRTLVELFSGVVIKPDKVALYGPKAVKGISRKGRKWITALRKIDKTFHVEKVLIFKNLYETADTIQMWSIFTYDQHDDDLADFLWEYAHAYGEWIDYSKSNALTHLNYKYRYFDIDQEFTETPVATFIGIEAVKDYIADQFSMVENIISDNITKEKADAVVGFLTDSISYVNESSEREIQIWTTTSFDDPYNIPVETLTLKLGSPHTFKEQFEWGLDNWGKEEAIRWGKTITVIAGALIKTGGILGTTLAGAGIPAAALGDAMIWGPTVVDWGCELGVPCEKVLPSLEATESVNSSVTESYNELNHEIHRQLKYLSDNLTYVTRISLNESKSLKTTKRNGNARSDIQIADMNLPPINLDVETYQEGGLIISNNSSASYTVVLTGDVLGPNVSGYGRSVISIIASSPEDFAPGESRTMKFRYSSPNTADFGVEGFEISLTAACVNQSTGEVIHVGPVTGRLIAGTSYQIEALSLVESGTLMSDTLTFGDTKEAVIDIPEGLQSITFNLSVADIADADLHVFNPSGEHIGMNYSTGEFESQITGAEYSGSNVKGEYVKLYEPETGTYRIRAVGQGGNAYFNVTTIKVPVMHGILSVSPQILNDSGLPGEDMEFNLLLAETGGGNEITDISISKIELSDDEGHMIPVEKIMVSSYSDTITKNGHQEIRIDIDTKDISAGTYSGIVTVTGNSGGKNISHEIAMELDIEDDDQPCKAIFTTDPLTGNAPMTVTFDATESSDGTYEWNYGDGSENEAGKTASHTYNKSGIYTITLNITTAEGCESMATETIVVMGGVVSGDANGDGLIDIFDALDVAKYDAILKTQSELNGFGVADVDCNGNIDIFDALRIAEYDSAPDSQKPDFHLGCK